MRLTVDGANQHRQIVLTVVGRLFSKRPAAAAAGSLPFRAAHRLFCGPAESRLASSILLLLPGYFFTNNLYPNMECRATKNYSYRRLHALPSLELGNVSMTLVKQQRLACCGY